MTRYNKAMLIGMFLAAVADIAIAVGVWVLVISKGVS
jgi:hypothetical protein